MAFSHAPTAVTNGLIFYYDMGNTQKSFKGAPTTNILPTSEANGRFTTANAWGTYNTNQYNGNTYFSIGTVSSVSGNVVTMTAAHPLRTYDAVQPQTSGGGLTAGTVYFIKKISSTQFSVHAYNGSQDGSQGYLVSGYNKVHESVATNQQVSINATSFPTMWWGPPHLPNSGLVKEIVTNGGPQDQSFMRFHILRTDGVADGMAYGVYTSVTAGDTINVSYWIRSSYPGKSLGYSTYFGSGSAYASGSTTTATWQRVKFQWTASVTFTFYQYFWPDGSTDVPYSIDICDLQVEVNTGAVGSTPFVIGTRSNTQALCDLTNNNVITATNLTYASDNTFTFNGSTSLISIPSLNLQRDFTLECWVKLTSVGTSVGFFGQGPTATNQGLHIGWFPGRGLLFGMYANDLECPSYSMTYNTWHHFVYTYNSSTYFRQTFADGVLVASGTLNPYSGSGQFNIGAIYSSASTPFAGNFDMARAYSRVLTASEITQNFTALKRRYGV